MEDLQTRFYCFVFYSSENVSDGYQTMTANDPLFLAFEMFLSEQQSGNLPSRK